MFKRGKRLLTKWQDEWKMTFMGLVLATKKLRFWAVFVPSFVIFGTLLVLLAPGLAGVQLIGTLGFPEGLKVIFDAFLGLFGVNQNFTDWIIVFSISLLQAILIALLTIVWKKRKSAAEVQNTGIVAGLAILGSGCPTCGTALMMPLLTGVFGTGALGFAGALSGVVTVAAVIVALFTLKKLGPEVYVIMMEEKL
ncbi:hypothetical protein IJH97_01375 [Candidatus Saccharibacteria bacterium]|nr:hypothetical protein [Candidatus Saccharibacteria bacterium]